ncbi:MAG: hypothetical protein HYX80_02475 [Chloroflexi bacterium]|nr:hypothetical protein [Chloroflexota bacterium]
MKANTPETKFRNQQKINSYRQRAMTAGNSFNAPFKAQPDKNDIFPQGKYVYYCALVVEAALEMNPAVRPLFVDAINALNFIEMMTFDNSINSFFSTQSNTIPLVANGEIKRITSNCQDSRGLGNYQEAVIKFINKAFPIPNIQIVEGSYLVFAISTGTAIEHKGTTFAELDQKRMKDDYRVMQYNTDDITNRPDRGRRKRMSLIKQQYKLHLAHEDALYGLAKLWYFAYIIKKNLTVASQLGEYKVGDQVIIIPVFSNPGTAHNKLHDFTLAMTNAV